MTISLLQPVNSSLPWYGLWLLLYPFCNGCSIKDIFSNTMPHGLTSSSDRVASWSDESDPLHHGQTRTSDHDARGANFIWRYKHSVFTLCHQCNKSFTYTIIIL